MASPPATTTTTAATTSTSPRSKATGCFTTKAAASSATSPKAAGIANASFGTSAAWLDYDQDGRLDLFVANYVQWTPQTGSLVLARRRHQILLHAGVLQGHRVEALSATWAAGKFEDATGRPASPIPTSKSLGVAVLDFDGDGWPDLFVANDTQPNKLYRNNRNGTFTEEGCGPAWPSARTAWRAARWASMPPTTIDPAGPTCWSATSRTRCSASTTTKATALFVDEAPRSTVGRASLLTLAFGVFFFDYDLDGLLDIFAANGHIEEEIGRVQPKVQYRQPPLLFRNLRRAASSKT